MATDGGFDYQCHAALTRSPDMIRTSKIDELGCRSRPPRLRPLLAQLCRHENPPGTEGIGDKLPDSLSGKSRSFDHPTLIAEATGPLEGESRQRMLPAVAVRELVTGDTGVINPDDEAPSGGAVSAATKKAAWRRMLSTNSLATAVHLANRQHRLDPIHPPHELRWRFQVVFTREPTAPGRDMKIRRPHARPRRH